MKYEREFLMNGKKPGRFTTPCATDVVFKDSETGNEYNSFYQMLLDFKYENYATTESFGTAEYHSADGIAFVWTDGVLEIVQRNEAYWILSLINSYLIFCSPVIARHKENGEIEIEANPLEVPDYDMFQISIVKLSDDTALFSIDVELYDDNEGAFVYKTIGCQYIPFTDMKDDYVYLFAKDGVLLHPQEY